MLANCLVIALRSCARIALPEEPLEQLARIGLHRQRRRRRAERDGGAVAAAVGAIAGAVPATPFGRHLERRQRRVLPDVRGGQLIDRDAAVRLLARFRRHATEPGARVERMHRRGDGRLVLEPADDRQLLLERLEGLEDRRQLEARALGGRRPVLHDRAVREIHEAHARLRRRGGAGQHRPRRNHRVEERQSDGHTRAAKEGATREMLLCDEHESVSGLPAACAEAEASALRSPRYVPLACRTAICVLVTADSGTIRIRNGSLRTIPITIDEKRYLSRADSRTMRRTVGMS